MVVVDDGEVGEGEVRERRDQVGSAGRGSWGWGSVSGMVLVEEMYLLRLRDRRDGT